ncbi:magnesium transporter CorA family protein [Candidatus Parcubacteria bacterium]|nr:magnesium transporter CorA family protein [Candidatus Parcubacteria bacterium]
MPQKKIISKNIQKIIIDNPVTPGGKVVWINIANARKTEIEYLRKKFNFNLSHLQASSSKATAQRTAMEYTNEYLFLILHFPVFDNGNIISGEIEFFVGEDYIITLHNNNVNALNKFFNLCKKDGNSTLSYEFESSAILLYEILDKLMIDCNEILDRNSINITNLEQMIFEQKSRKAVSQILATRRNIINTRKIMLNHKNIIKKLSKFESGNIPEHKIRKYYSSLLENSKRFWENLEIQKEMVEILNNTNESLLNNRLNDIMKTLTIFSVIVFPLTLLAAIFGMNTMEGMPFVNNPNGFWIIMAMMMFGCTGMLIIFAKKKWL